MGSVGANTGASTGSSNVIPELDGKATKEQVVDFYKSKLNLNIDNVINDTSRYTMIESANSLAKLYNEMPETFKKSLAGSTGINITFGNAGFKKNKSAMAAADIVFKQIYIQQKYFGKGQHDKFKDVVAKNSIDTSYSKHFHPIGATHADVISHELGHLIENQICRNNSPGMYHIAWNNKSYANQVINDAWKSVKSQFKNSDGTQMKKNDIIKSLSGYAATNPHETIAEAVSDYAANGNKAHPLSKEIWKNLKTLM